MESQYPNDSPKTIAVQFEFELKVHKTFNTIPIRFCIRFLTAVKMTHYVEI